MFEDFFAEATCKSLIGLIGLQLVANWSGRPGLHPFKLTSEIHFADNT